MYYCLCSHFLSTSSSTFSHTASHFTAVYNSHRQFAHLPYRNFPYIFLQCIILLALNSKVIKGGNIVCAQMGDPNASIPTPQPVYMRPMFGSFGKAAQSSSIAFISRRCKESGTGESFGLGVYRTEEWSICCAA